MYIVRIKFEYRCFPVWIYTANNELIENDLPPELVGDQDMEHRFLKLQKIYDSLYIDNKKEFRYVGFEKADIRENFFKEISEAIALLKQKLKGEYAVEDNMGTLRKRI